MSLSVFRMMVVAGPAVRRGTGSRSRGYSENIAISRLEPRGTVVVRRGESIVNLALVFGPLAIGALTAAALSGSPILVLGVLYCAGLYTAGLGLLFAAQLSLFRQGIWSSLGSTRMSRANRRRYKFAYALLLTGAVLNLMLLFGMFVTG